MQTLLTKAEAVETLLIAATRFNQSGKKTLASRLESLAQQFSNGSFDDSNPTSAPGQIRPVPIAPVVSERPSIAEQEITAKDLSGIPDYIAENGEVDLIESSIRAGLNVLLTGPTQCGKTTLSEWTARKMGRELFTIQGGAGATYERIIAKDTLVESVGVTITKRQLGVLPLAMKRGAILYVDEPNGIPSEVLFYLFSAMDYRKTITFDDGSTLKAAPGFVVIQAMNEGQGYSGTSLLNNAFRARSVVIDMAYLPADREAKLLQDRTGIKADISTKLAEAAASLRASQSAKVIRTPIGVSATLFCCSLIKVGLTVEKAMEVAIINQVPSQFVSERNSVRDVLAAFFGKGVK